MTWSPNTQNEERSVVSASATLNSCLFTHSLCPTPNPDTLCLLKSLWCCLCFLSNCVCVGVGVCVHARVPRRLPFLFGQLCSRGVSGILALDLLLNRQPLSSCFSLWSSQLSWLENLCCLPAPTDHHWLSLIHVSCWQSDTFSLRLHIAVSQKGGRATPHAPVVWEYYFITKYLEKPNFWIKIGPLKTGPLQFLSTSFFKLPFLFVCIYSQQKWEP